MKKILFIIFLFTSAQLVAQQQVIGPDPYYLSKELEKNIRLLDITQNIQITVAKGESEVVISQVVKAVSKGPYLIIKYRLNQRSELTAVVNAESILAIVETGR